MPRIHPALGGHLPESLQHPAEKMDAAILADQADRRRRRARPVSETHATPPSGAPVFPPGRYGRRRSTESRRPWLAALLALGALVVTSLIAVRLYQTYGSPHYDATVITYTEMTDSSVLITFRVTVPAGESAACVLRARARDGAEVGREDVRVDAPPGGTSVTSSHRLSTSRRAFVGEVLRCRAAG
jgi:hypothetical protein